MKRLIDAFPNLADSYFRVTSPCDDNYNCIAWAAGEQDRWWWPDRMGIYHWPATVERTESIHSFMKAFKIHGYEPCHNGEIEEGFEKVAIFTGPLGAPTHMARQLDSGKWTSKIGSYEDIEHTISGVEGDSYGVVANYLKRRRQR
jgi:hypothetical protein